MLFWLGIKILKIQSYSSIPNRISFHLFEQIGASLDDDPEPETDEIVLDSLYPPDFKYRQRRLSRMFSLEHKMLTLKKSMENLI